MINKAMTVVSLLGFTSAIFLTFSSHESGNGEACLAWSLVALLGFGNFCGYLADSIKEVA